MNLQYFPLSGLCTFSRRYAIGLATATALMAGGGAGAQPSGNPKGTIAPSAEGNAAKAPAGSRPAAMGESSSGPLTSESGPASARMRRTEPPGGGTAGGLTNRNLTTNDPASKSTTNKGSAGQRPVMPSAASSAPAR